MRWEAHIQDTERKVTMSNTAKCFMKATTNHK